MARTPNALDDLNKEIESFIADFGEAMRGYIELDKKVKELGAEIAEYEQRIAPRLKDIAALKKHFESKRKSPSRR